MEFCCAVASQKWLIGPEKRVTRECKLSIHVDQECFKCSLLGGKPKGLGGKPLGLRPCVRCDFVE